MDERLIHNIPPDYGSCLQSIIPETLWMGIPRIPSRLWIALAFYNPWDIIDGRLIHNILWNYGMACCSRSIIWAAVMDGHLVYNILLDMACSIYNFMHTMIWLTQIPQYFGWETENDFFCILQYECNESYLPRSSLWSFARAGIGDHVSFSWACCSPHLLDTVGIICVRVHIFT
jgi:hypothetical protein